MPVHQLPVGVHADGHFGLAEIGLVIRAEMEASPLPCPLGGGVQKFVLENPVLVMPALGPWVREKNEDRGKRRGWRQRFEEVPGVGVDEMQVVELRPIPLALAANDPIEADVDADAEPVGIGCGVSGEKVAVAAADFPDEWRRRQDLGKKGPEVIAALADPGEMLGGALGIVHGLALRRRACSPTRFDMNQQDADI